MKIFFVGSIRGKKEYQNIYQQIVDILKNTGNTILADHILKTNQAAINELSLEEKTNFHQKVLEGIKNADIIVAEISYPSVSVGYLISFALDCGKPTIVLYNGSEEPNILTTIEKTDKFFALKYKDIREIKRDLVSFVEDATQQMDVRFNFFISPKIGVYLDWMSRTKKVPRAVYLRKLIEEDMAGSGYVEKGNNNNKNKNKKK